MSVTRQQKEKLKNNLEKLSECEHEQVFKIINKFTDQYTCSETGVLVSADSLNQECVEEIQKYIDFCFAQKERLDTDEAQRIALYKTFHSNE
jgi:hypothetical protein